jgi:hypothetical protein
MYSGFSHVIQILQAKMSVCHHSFSVLNIVSNSIHIIVRTLCSLTEWWCLYYMLRFCLDREQLNNVLTNQILTV